MTRTTQRARRAASAIRSSKTRAAFQIALESLELRRLLSGYVQTDSISGTTQFGDFGRGVATNGDWALIAQPGGPELSLSDPGRQVSVVNMSTHETHVISDPAVGNGDQFGTAVAWLAGGKIAVAAPSSGQLSAGHVYIYNGYDDTNPVVIDNTFSPNPQDGSVFGQSLAVIGNDLLVGTTFAFPGTGNGLIARYDSSGNLLQTYVNPTVTTFDQFGTTIGVDNNDIYSMAVNPNNEYVVVELDGTTGVPVNTIHEPNSTPNDGFGSSLAFSNNTVFIGAYGVNTVYQLDENSPNSAPLHTYAPPPTAESGTIGFGAAMAVNGSRLVIGNLNATTGGFPTGEAYAYDTSGNYIATIANPTPELNPQGGNPDAFGMAVASLPNGKFIISDGFDDNNVTFDTGSVFVFAPANTAPTANPIVGPTSGDVGQSLSYTGSFNDPDAGDTHQVSWDWGDGNVIAFHSTDDPGALTPSHTYNTAGNKTMTMTIRDAAGATSSSQLVVTITNPTPANTPPTANPISGPSSGVRQQTLTFTGSYSDPDANDPHDVSWDFGDGTVIAFHSTADTGALTPSHAYVASGSYTVVMTVRDSHGEVSSSQKNVAISATLLSGGDLYVGGTSGNDKINISKASGGANVAVNGPNTYYPVTGKIIIFGGDGNDSIQSNSDVPRAFEIYGGAGNDTIKGGLGNDIFVGDGGKDQITGNDGRDILIGGTGTDALTSNNGDDILIAASTSFDNDPSSLRAILAEWSSGRTYTERVNNLRNGTGSAVRANGNVFLQADVTVFDDAAQDTLTGNGGTDWFFANIDFGTRDKTDAKTGEIVDDVDIVV